VDIHLLPCDIDAACQVATIGDCLGWGHYSAWRFWRSWRFAPPNVRGRNLTTIPTAAKARLGMAMASSQHAIAGIVSLSSAIYKSATRSVTDESASAGDAAPGLACDTQGGERGG
jgi:hypothetical protein